MCIWGLNHAVGLGAQQVLLTTESPDCPKLFFSFLPPFLSLHLPLHPPSFPLPLPLLETGSHCVTLEGSPGLLETHLPSPSNAGINSCTAMPLLTIFFFKHTCVHVCPLVCVRHDMLVEAREQLSRSFLFFCSCGPWALNSGHQPW